MKIASLLSSGTEIAVTLGAESELAGISHECDYPDSIRHLPVLTESRIDHMARSDIIHMQVQERLIKALSIYNVKTELLSSLKPDVIITQHQCEVCAVSFSDVCNAISDLVNMNVEIVSLNPASLQEIFEDIRRIASAIKRNPETVIDKMKSKIEEVRQRTASLKNKPRVAFIEWIKPIFIGSNWMPELIEIAGGIPLFGESGKKSHIIEFSELVKSDPDVIIIAPCGFKLSQTEKDLNLLTSETGWEELKAVRNKKVYITDGNSYFNRSGPRITESLELLAGLIHSESRIFERELVKYRQMNMWADL